ncbi:MAG: aspartate/glutamate racemase family protein, partial [Desulfarculaceae bacterium]|jgi:Asp/Glu/hydantoin racemase
MMKKEHKTAADGLKGYSVGLVMLDTKFTRIPGDIGNPATFSFPLRYQVVKGASINRVVFQRDKSLLEPFLEACQALCQEGVKVLVTTCGFLAMFHRELSQSLEVPIFTSSLLQVPLVYAVTGQRRVGILTANSDTLTDLHFESVGASHIPRAVEGVQHTYFGDFLLNDREGKMDVAAAEQDMVGMANRLVSGHDDIGAIVLECTNMPPFARAVQRAVGLPVFDIVTLTNMAYENVNRRAYS